MTNDELQPEITQPTETTTDAKKNFETLVPIKWRNVWAWGETCFKSPLLIFTLAFCYFSFLAFYCLVRGIPFMDFVSSPITMFWAIAGSFLIITAGLYAIYFMPAASALILVREHSIKWHHAAVIFTFPYLTLFFGGSAVYFSRNPDWVQGAIIFGYTAGALGAISIIIIVSKFEALQKSFSSPLFIMGGITSFMVLLISIYFTHYFVSYFEKVEKANGGNLDILNGTLIYTGLMLLFFALPTWIACARPSKNWKESAARGAIVFAILFGVFPGPLSFADGALRLLNVGGDIPHVFVLDAKIKNSPSFSRLLAERPKICGNSACKTVETVPIRLRFLSPTTAYVLPPKTGVVPNFWEKFMEPKQELPIAISRAIILSQRISK